MADMNTELEGLKARLDKLERSNRRWRGKALAHLASIVLLAYAAAAQSLPGAGQATAGTYLRLCQNESVCLVPVDNVWTFIELDTRYGLVSEVQFGFTPEKRFTVAIPGSNSVIGDDNMRVAEALCVSSATSDAANRAKYLGADGRPTGACLAGYEAKFPARVGRFSLYPTNNIFSYLLLDKDTGDVWQVQRGDNRNIWHLNEVLGTTSAK